MSEQTVLVVQHEEGAPAGWLGEELERTGLRLHTSRPYDGQQLAPLEGHAGLVVLGGAVDAWDSMTAPWLPGVEAMVREAEDQGLPVLGICLGHQVAARALGGEVGRNPAGPMVAVVPLCWAEDAADDDVLGGMRRSPFAVHWNNDVVTTLPAGARVLARSPDGAVQAARLGETVWGVQFHPEAGPEIIERWVREDGEPHRAAGRDLDGYLADVRRLEDELAAGCRSLADAFAARVVGR